MEYLTSVTVYFLISAILLNCAAGWVGSDRALLVLRRRVVEGRLTLDKNRLLKQWSRSIPLLDDGIVTKPH